MQQPASLVMQVDGLGALAGDRPLALRLATRLSHIRTARRTCSGTALASQVGPLSIARAEWKRGDPTRWRRHHEVYYAHRYPTIEFGKNIEQLCV